MESETIRKKINILIVANEIFPDAHGGVHTYIHELSNGLSRLGHKVFVLARKVSQDSPASENKNGITIYRYQTRSYRLAIFGLIANIFKVRDEFNRIAGENRFDIINIHSPHASLGINLSKSAKKIPKVYTFHAPLAQEEMYEFSLNSYKWYSWRKYIKPVWLSAYLFFSHVLENRALLKCDKIISLSRFTANCLMKAHRIPESKIVKIAAGVDTERFSPQPDKGGIRKRLSLASGKFMLLTVRRLVPRMGLENLIEAMPYVLAKLPETVLIIGGAGPLYLTLKTLIEKLKLEDKIFLAGFIPEDKLPLYYKASDLFILPSKTLEGFGIVTLEALSSAVPVLATPIGASPEILSALDKGLLFDGTSAELMAKRIKEYLCDKEKYSAISGKCREFVLNNYSWEKTALETESLFQSILKYF